MAGFVSAGLFSSLLQLPRAAFVAAHALVASAFLACYVKLTHIHVRAEAGRRWRRGLLAGVVLGVALVRGVRMQPSSAAPSGGALTASIAWFGLIYGMADALLLNVVPAHIVLPSSTNGRAGSGGKTLTVSAAALAASLLVTAAYHLGFAEFRGPALLQPLIGNAIITAGYLATGSPLAAIVSHVIMHVAAVMHGMESTVQLPPHY
jgi:hypothetical protein